MWRPLPNEMEIRYLFRRRRYGYRDLKYVQFSQLQGQYASRHNVIALGFPTGKELMLVGFQEGDELLHDKISKAIAEGTYQAEPT